jgi:hypothetical protein
LVQKSWSDHRCATLTTSLVQKTGQATMRTASCLVLGEELLEPIASVVEQFLSLIGGDIVARNEIFS